MAIVVYNMQIMLIITSGINTNTVYCYALSKGCIQEIFEDIKGTDNTMTK
jgi:hypothetical protein